MTDELSRTDGNSYLWDRSGPPDPQLREWETLLGQVRAATRLRTPHFQGAPVPARFSRTLAVRWHDVARLPRARFALAASVALVAVATVLWRAFPGTGVAVEALAGAPFVSGLRIEERMAMPPGAVVETDADSQARLRIGRIGWVQIRPSSSVRLVDAQQHRYRLALRRGAVRADISAEPRVFVVDVPFATAIDLGCAYDLVVDEAGRGSLTVEEGWVALESPGRQALVPEGGRALTRGRDGIGSPYYLDASPEFVAALARVDFSAAERSGEARAALATVLAQARNRDAITLLTLLRRVDAGGRLLIFDRLRVLLPPPDGVTRAGIGSGDLVMIDLWWKALGLKFDKKPPVALSSG